MSVATEKTMKRLQGAANRHDLGDLRDSVLAQIEKGLSQTAASSLISLVEALPKLDVPVVSANKVTEPGFYRHPADNRIVKVQRSKAGHLYAMEMPAGEKPRFVSGLISQLDATLVADAPAVAVADGVNPELVALLQEMAAKRAG